MFIPDRNGMFFLNIQTALIQQLGTQMNEKHQNKESRCLQEVKVMFAMWLLTEGVYTMLQNW